MAKFWIQRKNGNFGTFPIEKFYKGKDILNNIFEGEGNSKVPQYFQSLFESGIQGRLDLELVKRKCSLRSMMAIPKRKDTPVGLDASICTLFILCGAVIGSSVLIGIIELRKILYLAGQTD